MAIQRINYGAAPDDGTGDPLRQAFKKTDDNFVDLDDRKAEATNVATALGNKVDKVPGKQLSTEDFTTVEKQKLDGVQPNATQNRPDSENVTVTSGQRLMTEVEGTKLAGIATGATANRPDSETATTTSVAQAIATAATFAAVPTTFQSWVVYVTLPHWRTFVWTGTKYERAPWHMPGEIIPSDGPAAKIRQAIQMRSDVVYNTADYPDLAEFYGFTGPTFVLKDARARVIRGADLGRNVDTALVNGYLQADAVGAWSASVTLHGGGAATTVAAGSGTGFIPSTVRNAYRTGGENVTGATSLDGFTIAPPAAMSAAETRVKSLVATHYVTI